MPPNPFCPVASQQSFLNTNGCASSSQSIMNNASSTTAVTVDLCSVDEEAKTGAKLGLDTVPPPAPVAVSAASNKNLVSKLIEHSQSS